MTEAQYQINHTLNTTEWKLREAREELADAVAGIQKAMNGERFDLVAQYATKAQAAQEKIEMLRFVFSQMEDCYQVVMQVA